MFKPLSKIENLIFLVVTLILLALNIYGSTFMLASYWPCLDKNMVVPFLISLLLSSTLLYIFRKVDVSKKTTIISIIVFSVIGLVFRLILNNSFSTYPASDQWQTLNHLNAIINNNDYGPLNKGNYFSIYPHLLLLVLPMYIPVKLFGYTAIGYYNLNAILIVISFMFITLFINKTTNNKTALFACILLNLFIPSYFLDFVIYGDVFSLFFISLALFLFAIRNNNISIVLAFLSIGLAYICRSNSIVWAVALFIAYLVFNKLSYKSIITLSLSLIVLITPKMLINNYFENKLQIDLNEYSLPTSSWIYTGTSYNLEGDAGIYNPFGLCALEASQYDSIKTNIIIKEGIKDNLKNFTNPKELALFLKRKIQNTWCDPDFETMGFVMPNSGYVVQQVVEEGYRIPVGTAPEGTTYTNKLGQFVYENFTKIRMIEKIYLFLILIISITVSFIRNKRNDFNIYSMFLQLNIIGFFILQLFMETKPRYVLISFIVMIVYAIYELSYLTTKTNVFGTQNNCCYRK